MNTLSALQALVIIDHLKGVIVHRSADGDDSYWEEIYTFGNISVSVTEHIAASGHMSVRVDACGLHYSVCCVYGGMEETLCDSLVDNIKALEYDDE